MEWKIKYSELEYKRPDISKISLYLDDLAEKVRTAKTYQEVKEVYESYDAIVCQVRSQAVLVQLRSWCDMSNEFYQQECVEFLAIADSLLLPKNLCSAFLDSIFLKDLTDEYGVMLARQLKGGLISNHGEDIAKQEQMLQNQYQMLVQSLKYSLDGKEITSEELTAMRKSDDCIAREKSQKVIYEAYLEKKEDFEKIFSSLIKLRNQRARLNGFKNYIHMGNCFWGRYDYDEAEIKKASSKILKYFKPLYEELIEIQKKDMKLDSISICDRMYRFNNGEPLHGDLLKACHKMFHQLGKETGKYFDKLIEQDAFDLAYSPVKMPGVAFQNYITDINIAPIFGSFKDSPSDVFCVVHEFGHSFQEYQSALNHKSIFNIVPPIDIAEIASRSMEFFIYKYADLFCGEDASKWIYYHATDVVYYIMTFCVENEFEDYLYENENATLEEITKEYLKIKRKYLPYDYDKFEALMYQGADYFMFDSFINFSKYTFGYVPAYINAIELVFHTDDSYNNFLDMCKHLGYRTYEETLNSAGLHHAFNEEAINMAVNTLRNVIKNAHMKL